MTTITKYFTVVFLVLAAAVLFFARSVADAAGKEMPTQTCPGQTDAGNKHCDLLTATVGPDGILHCTYDCYTVPKQAAAAKALSDLSSNARSLFKQSDPKDPSSLSKANAALKDAHNKRIAYAKQHNIKIFTETHISAARRSSAEKKE